MGVETTVEGCVTPTDDGPDGDRDMDVSGVPLKEKYRSEVVLTSPRDSKRTLVKPLGL